MNIYANWLDGEYIKLTKQKPTHWEADLNIERQLKLCALLGDTMVLSDVQLIDSEIITQSFTKPEFRSFLKENSDFVQLSAEPEAKYSDFRFSVATAGLRRCLDEAWIPSSIDDPTPIRKLAKAILSEGNVDPSFLIGKMVSGDFGHTLGEVQMYKSYLEGIVWGLHHFVNNKEPGCYEAVGPRTDYYSVLLKTRDSLSLSGDHRKYLEATVDFVEQQVQDEGDRKKRSVVYPLLKLKLRGTEERKIIWYTIVHAWNHAVQSRMKAHVTIGKLEPSCPVGVYIDNIPISWHVSGGPEPAHPWVRLADHLKCDPLQVSWQEISKARSETAVTRNGYQNSLLANDDRKKNTKLEEHLAALGKVLAGKYTIPIHSVVRAALLVTTGGTLAATEELATLARRFLVVNALRSEEKGRSQSTSSQHNG